MSYWDEWFRRRRRYPFFREMDRMFEEMFKDLSKGFPEELEKKPAGKRISIE